MHLEDLTPQQARTYCDHVIARGPRRMSQLAKWMAADRGPVDEMDASLECLVVLWAWYRSFSRRDCPGVEYDGLPSALILWGRDTEPPLRVLAVAYVLEAISHYVFEVLLRLYPETEWDVCDYGPWRGARTVGQNETAIRIGRSRFVRIMTTVGTFAARVRDGDELARPERAIAEALQTILGLDALPVQEPRPSILSPLVDAPTPALPAEARLRRFTDESVADPDEIPGRQRARGESFLYRGPGEPEVERDEAPPIPIGPMTEVLNLLGFRHGERNILPSDLSGSGASFDHIDGRGYVEAYVFGGELRELRVAPLNATDAHWTPILRTLKEFAASVDATLE